MPRIFLYGAEVLCLAILETVSRCMEYRRRRPQYVAGVFVCRSKYRKVRQAPRPSGPSQQDDYRRSVVELLAPREAPKTQRRPKSISLDVQDVMKEN